MASNIYYAGDGYGDGGLTFDRPINLINVYVSLGTTFGFSLDQGDNYLTVPPGFYSIPIGSVLRVDIISNGAWQLIGVTS